MARRLRRFVMNSSSGLSVLTINNNAGTDTYSGVIGLNAAAGSTYNTQTAGSGNIALVKTGGGTLTLSGSNNYTGGTTVSAGTLLLTTTVCSPATTPRPRWSPSPPAPHWPFRTAGPLPASTIC